MDFSIGYKVGAPRQPTKQEIYDNLRKKGVKDDKKGVEFLAKFKLKRDLKNFKDKKRSNDIQKKFINLNKFIKTHLEKRRIQLGVDSTTHPDLKLKDLTFPIGEYEKAQRHFEVRTGLD